MEVKEDIRRGTDMMFAPGAKVQVCDPALPKDMLLVKFREHVIRMPEHFKQILSNKLQITELKRIYA